MPAEQEQETSENSLAELHDLGSTVVHKRVEQVLSYPHSTKNIVNG